MKLNKPDKTRTVHAMETGEGHIVLIECTRVDNISGGRAYKWQEERVQLCPHELNKLVAMIGRIK